MSLQTEMRISSIDWQHWTPQVIATLLFVVDSGRVLLIRKKRGLGAGKINGPGGKLEPDETPLACAIRETREELLIEALQVRPAGELFFHAEDMPRIHAHVFVATDYRGIPSETAEATPIWFSFDQIPYDEMWQDDRLWLPQVLCGQRITGWFSFIEETLIDHKVVVEPD
ncbi:MAG: 8-oxo-dGTP diphosphatase [Proteobacteria bacterium]|nr:8-oxo-dGTP diphosphatase [Pseudomonadota bacterium]MDA1298995.1 8-oxo-dGTP diphosphatase [Pseudomonadota bacterium]